MGGHIPSQAGAGAGGWTVADTWGGRGSGPGEFHTPKGVAVDDKGFVYVADTYNHRIQQFTHGFRFVRQWGCYGDAPGQLAAPRALATAPDGTLYVADTANQRVQRFAHDLSADTTPPLTTCSAPETWSPAPVLATLLAADDVGSVAVTYWRLGRTVPFAPYAPPIVADLPGQTLLQFFSVDGAGNQEDLRSRWLYVSSNDN